ncbi:MAG: DUF4833 domain-containing protein [Endomicrobium sp.]|jgi:hypothetical protein|nr:DUF4833 domain-containing protein [Endomicrobium sp.]
MLRIFLAVFIVLTFAVFFLNPLIAIGRRVNLFRIERNKNANVVMYDAILDSNGNIDSSSPIDSYWILYARRGERSEINTIEKKAYGFNAVYNSRGYYDLTLRAAPDVNIKVVMVDDEPKAVIKINNRDAYLSTIFVFAEGNLVPSVLYYTLTGTDVKDGVRITQRVNVD